jgi:GNAT superfamily N-acetyltransferase
MTLIHLATPDDVPELLPLVERYWKFEGLRSFSNERIENLLREAIANPTRAACWLAMLDRKVLGYLLVVFVFSLEHGGMMGEIDEFYVEPDVRSKGIGSELLRVAERVLGRAGYLRLQMQLGADNERGRAFYQRHGFKRRSGFDLWDKALAPAGAPSGSSDKVRRFPAL